MSDDGWQRSNYQWEACRIVSFLFLLSIIVITILFVFSNYINAQAGVGLVKSSIIPVRAQPNDYSERVSEALMGEMVRIIKQKQGWLYVRLLHQYDYEGWVRAESVAIGEEYSQQIPVVIVKSTEAKVLRSDNTVMARVLMGSLLKAPETSAASSYYIWVVLPGNRGGWIPKDSVKNYNSSQFNANSDDIIATALKFQAVPYLWGGMSVKGIDCSGFTHVVFRTCGAMIHRDADLQFEYDGVPVTNENLREGDLVFFCNRRGEVNHVGIYVGNYKFIHASSTANVTISDLYSPGYQARCVGARRITSE